MNMLVGDRGQVEARERLRPLVETFFVVAMLPRAGGRVGADGVPHLGTRRRTEFVAQAGVSRLGPCGDALEFVVVRIGEEAGVVGKGVAVATGMKVGKFCG